MTMNINAPQKDVSSQFHNALYLGDVPERVKILRLVDH